MLLLERENRPNLVTNPSEYGDNIRDSPTKPSPQFVILFMNLQV